MPTRKPEQPRANTPEYMKMWYEGRKKIYKDRHLRKTYGLSLQNFFDKMAQQGNQCLICDVDLRDLPPKSIHIDHNHTTGKVRGVLCGICNKGLGAFRDSKSLLTRALQYLEENDA